MADNWWWLPKPQILIRHIGYATEIPKTNLGFPNTLSSKKTVPGRLRQRPTTENGNIYVLGVVVAITWLHFYRVRHGWKYWICRRICHSSRDISISGFGGHIAISGCRSMLQSLTNTFSTSTCRNSQICRWNFNDTYVSVVRTFRAIKFQFRRPYCCCPSSSKLLSLKSPGGIFIPSATRALPKNRSAIRGLNVVTFVVICCGYSQQQDAYSSNCGSIKLYII